MIKDNYYKKIADYFNFGKSKRLISLLKDIFSEKEAIVISILPGTSLDVSKKMNLNSEKVEKILIDLFYRGVVIIEKLNSKDLFKVPEDVGVFMDMVLFDLNRYLKKGDSFYNRWKEFYNREYLVQKAANEEDLGLRVIPVNHSFQGSESSRIQTLEEIEKILKNAKIISVENCACRTRERNCEYPMEVCIGLDDLARYCIKRGIGKEITFKEALDIIKLAEDKGLVHMTANSDNPNVICNCCTCCCSLMKAVIETGNKKALAKSRYRAQIDDSLCDDCLICTEACHFECLVDKNGKLYQNTENCYGCGLCTRVCPQRAIKLVETEKEDFIPTGPGFLDSDIPEKEKNR